MKTKQLYINPQTSIQELVSERLMDPLSISSGGGDYIPGIGTGDGGSPL